MTAPMSGELLDAYEALAEEAHVAVDRDAMRALAVEVRRMRSELILFTKARLAEGDKLRRLAVLAQPVYSRRQLQEKHDGLAAEVEWLKAWAAKKHGPVTKGQVCLCDLCRHEGE